MVIRLAKIEAIQRFNIRTGQYQLWLYKEKKQLTTHAIGWTNRIRLT